MSGLSLATQTLFYFFSPLNKCQQLSLLSPSLCELVILAAFGSSEWPFGPPKLTLHRFPGMASNFRVVRDFQRCWGPMSSRSSRLLPKKLAPLTVPRAKLEYCFGSLAALFTLSPWLKNFLKMLGALVWNLHPE